MIQKNGQKICVHYFFYTSMSILSDVCKISSLIQARNNSADSPQNAIWAK